MMANIKLPSKSLKRARFKGKVKARSPIAAGHEIRCVIRWVFSIILRVSSNLRSASFVVMSGTSGKIIEEAKTVVI
ncbi:hypothetical protein D9M72_645230 [compost metagenome]